jgi:hypothetical protein
VTRKLALTPIRQLIRCSRHYLRDGGSVSLYSEQRPVGQVHLTMAPVLVDTHDNDPEQFTMLHFPLSDALLDHLPLFLRQM